MDDLDWISWTWRMAIAAIPFVVIYFFLRRRQSDDRGYVTYDDGPQY